MKAIVYPAIFEKVKDGYFVTIPDLNKNTQGRDMAEAIAMARDLISLLIIDYEDDGEKVPAPNTVKILKPKNAILSYVDVDISAYRKKYGTKIVKKNCTIPAWLNTKAEEMKINFSQALQEALIQKINVED